MQTAKGTVILSPEHHQHKHDITPAEMMILHRMHFQNAQGSPLGDDWVLTGEAKTVDAPAQPGVPEEFNIHTGKMTPGKPPVPEKSHARTNREEIERLKRKYTGNIAVGSEALPAFIAVFGKQQVVELPKTFAEIEEYVTVTVSEKESPNATSNAARKSELGKLPRQEIVKLVVEKGGRPAAHDGKDYLIAWLINEENKAEVPKKGKGKEDDDGKSDGQAS